MLNRGKRRQRQELHRDVEQFGPLVYRLAFRIVHNQADAEDVAQEVFVKYVQARRRNGVANPRAWLSITALNTARNVLRGEKNRKRREDSWARDPQRHPPQSAKEDGDEVWDAVERLPDDLKFPLLLHYQEGLKYREIAAALRCPPGTVATRISQAKEQIRTQMSQSERRTHERPRTSPTGRA
ncbi:MAG: RNA polymerase sigma factor [Planctomycetota bacterium]